MGRPSSFTQEVADKICQQIATTSRGIRSICSDEGMPVVSTVMKWLCDNKPFSEQYARAKEQQAEMLVEEMLEIADETSKDTIVTDKGEIPNSEWIARSRLRVDSRKWLASKLLPKKYGDKMELSGSLALKMGKELEDEQYKDAANT